MKVKGVKQSGKKACGTSEGGICRYVCQVEFRRAIANSFTGLFDTQSREMNHDINCEFKRKLRYYRCLSR